MTDKKSTLDDLTQKYKTYIDDASYVYKLCCDMVDKYAAREWLVILQKLEDTKTNEDRKDVADHLHAKFRADKLKVVEIVSVLDPRITKDFVVNEFHNIRAKYTKGEIVSPDRYEKCIDNVCSGGIH